jgi:pilus assembly protein CpaE
VTSKLCVYGLPDFDSRLVPGFNVVATTIVQNEVLTALGTLEPDVVLLDLDEPNSIGTILKVMEIRPQVGVVGVTNDTDIQRLLAAQRAGCSQVVTRPLDADDLGGALYRALGQKGSAPSASRTFAVLGTIGGAGATTVATHLAIEIAHVTKQATALFDLDFECGGVADAFDLRPQYTIADLTAAGAADAALLKKASSVLPSGVHVFARPQTIREAHAIDETTLQYILHAAQRSYPYAVLDLPRHLSPITGVAIERCSKLVLVLQLTVPSLKNTRHLIETLTNEGVPGERIELVVNRYHKRANTCSIETVEQEFQRPVRAVVPSDFKAVHCALDIGKPLANRSPVRSAIRELATRLTGHERALKRT